MFSSSYPGTALAQPADEALELFKKGGEAKKYGRYQEAIDYYERSMKIWEELSKSLKFAGPSGVAGNLMQIGNVYASIGQHDKALSYHEEALKIFRQLNMPDYIAMSLNDMGNIYLDIGQHEKALSCFEEALKIEEINKTKNISETLRNIGKVYESLGQYEKVLFYYEESLKIGRQLNIPYDIAVSLFNIGKIYLSSGQYEQALSYCEDALNIFRQLNISRGITATLSSIGSIYYTIERYDRALSYYGESLKIDRQLNIPYNIATNLNNIGVVYESLGQYDKALLYHEESLKVLMQIRNQRSIAISLNNICRVYDNLGQYDKALSYCEESLKIKRELNNPRDISASLLNIGVVYLSERKYKEAEEKFLEADKEIYKVGIKSTGNPGLVEVYIATGRSKDALSLLRDRDMIPRWNSDDTYRIQFHIQHGLVLKDVGRFKEASYEFFKAVSLSEDMRQKVKVEKSGFLGAGTAGGRIRAYKGLVAVLSERAIKGEKIDENFIAYGKDLASSAFYFAEATKARTLLESMAKSARKYNKTELPIELRKKEENILHQLSAIENIWEDTYKKGEAGFKELVKRKEELKKELDSFIALLRKEYPLYASLNYPRPAPAEDLPLKDNEVLIEYAIGDDACYVFVVRKGGVKNLLKIPISREVLEEKVKALMEPMNTGRHSEFSVSMAKGLYDILLADLFKDIKETEKVIIIPDGILGLLPFEVLVVKKGEGYKDSLYVGDKWTISYSQSATALALTRILKPSKANKPLFAIGNPVYSKDDPRYIAYKQGKPKQTLLVQNMDQYAYRGVTIVPKMDKTDKDGREWEEVVFTPLPETEDEVKAISKLFDTKPEAPDVLLNVMANETNLRKVLLEDYRYLHFATHADLPGKVQGMKEPFIILGQVENKDKDDGFLTLSEVLDLGLDADMIVLSACVTGRGKMMEGEGVVSFARAFQHAGARSVVVSLWEVASKETVEYMEIFYSHIKEGKSRAEALTLARNTIKSRYPNPFYWSPFILHGER